jgi:AraC family transcriptional regulator of adaptative response / DNA-3-methyladenine glycosylase II
MGNDERYYRAYRARDARFDGRFFLGVTTTGIYCRPVCPAPSPRPSNVRYFACAAAAEDAGFRPCRRCRPETCPGTPAWLGSSATVSRALRLMGEATFDEVGLEPLAERLGVTARHLRRLFAKHLGASPHSVLKTRRVHFARVLIDETTVPMHTVALHAGFQSVRQFNHAILHSFGESPTKLRGRARARSAALAGTAGLTVRLPYRPPFDWTTTAAYLRDRAIPGVEEVTASVYRRTIENGRSSGWIEVRPVNGQHALSLRIALADPVGLLGIVTRVRRIFDLDADALSIMSDLRRDARLRGLIRPSRGVRVPGTWNGFELAVRAILGQQVSVRAATTLSGRLVREFGVELRGGGYGALTNLFPTPASLVEAPVERIGLPAARAGAIRALARAIDAGELRLDGSAGLEGAVEQLTRLPGIGRWTAAYVAMRALGEPDAFPEGDLGLRRAMGNGSGPPSATALARAAEAWRPWRSYAAVALWTVRHETEEVRT